MRVVVQISILLLIGSLFSCNNGTSDGAGSVNSAKPKTKNCFKKQDYNYERIFPIELVRAVYPFDESEMKVDEITEHGEYNNRYYRWPSDRPERDGPSKFVKLPDDNFIGIGSAHPFNEKQSTEEIRFAFDRQYKQLTEEELKKMEADIDRTQADKPEKTREMAKKLLRSRGKMKFEPVGGVGEAAFWRFGEKNGGELVVLAGNEKFTIYLKISNDDSENLETGKKIANAVINSCGS